MALDLTTPENQAELAKLIQSEADKVRTKYSTEQKGLQDQLTQLQLQSMSVTQKAEFETKAKMDAFALRETEFNKKLLTMDTKELLVTKGLGVELEVLLTADTIEGRKAQLDVLAKAMNLTVKDTIVKKIGDEPGSSNSGVKGAADFKWDEMSYGERSKLYLLDQKLYEEVKKQSKTKL